MRLAGCRSCRHISPRIGARCDMINCRIDIVREWVADGGGHAEGLVLFCREVTTMSLTCRLFESIDDLDLAAWERVLVECGAPIFMDPRFVGAVEISMRRSYRFWYVIVYENGSPVACACLTAMTLDLADFSDPYVASILRRLPQVFSRFRRLKVFLCGLPGLPADKALALSSPASSPKILSVLDELICDLAAQERSDGIIYKEFGSDDLEWSNALLNLGYSCVATPPMHFFRPSFKDFSHYCGALKTRYRQQINRSTRKLNQVGISFAILTDPDEILELYTSEVHDLYYQMVGKRK